MHIKNNNKLIQKGRSQLTNISLKSNTDGYARNLINKSVREHPLFNDFQGFYFFKSNQESTFSLKLPQTPYYLF